MPHVLFIQLLSYGVCLKCIFSGLKANNLPSKKEKKHLTLHRVLGFIIVTNAAQGFTPH